MIYNRSKSSSPIGTFDIITINLWVIYFMHDLRDKQGWIRLFGSWWGIKYKPKDATRIYSERSGNNWNKEIFGYFIGVLKPCK